MPKTRAEQSQDASVQARATPGLNLMLWAAAGGSDLIAPWWSRTRDAQLRSFWRTVDHLAGAVYTMESRLKTVPFHIRPRDFGIKTHMRQADEYTDILLNESDFGNGWGDFYSKFVEDLLCLAGTTRVALGGDRRGKTMSIRDIVRDEDPGPVIALHPDGYLTEELVTEWHVSPLGDRRWWWISTEAVSGHSRNGRGGLFLTEDHPLLTDDGWKQARSIEPGTKIATGDPEPSDEQSELLTGMMLGDASLSIVRKRTALRLSHALDQEPWLRFKMAALTGFSWTGYGRYTVKGFKGYQSQDQINVNSRATASLNSWREAWCPSGNRKALSRDHVERWFSPRMMATWFCDDGSLSRNKTRIGNPTSPHMVLYTNRHIKADVEWLTGFLSGKGFPCRVHAHNQKNNGKVKTYWIIYVTTEGTRRLVEFMGAFVPPPMRRKMPDFAPAYNPSLWEIEPARPFWDTVVESRPRPHMSGYREIKTTYHIGVGHCRTFIAAGLVSHNTQDNGCFTEIIGDGPPDGPIVGRSYGIHHLDSFRCQRTSDPEFPIIYQSRDGHRYKLHYTRVAFTAQQPSPAEEMFGIGMCAVSRCVNVAQSLLDIAVYKMEKLGSRPKRALMITTGGLDPEDIRDALALADQEMNNQALRRFSKIPTVGSRDITEAGIDLVDMVSLPDGFDERESITLGMAAISLAFGVDARELFPGLDSGATRAEALIAHIKQRGKGPGEILLTTERMLNAKFLPRHLEIIFDFQDDEQDRQRAEIKNLRAIRYVNLSVAALLDERTMREQMLEEGDLTQAQFEREELQEGRLVDGSDVLTLFNNPEFRELLDLGMENPTDLEVNEAAIVLAAIADRARLLTAQLAGANPGQANKLHQALAALERLKMLFGGRSAAATAPRAPAARRAEAGQEMLEGDTGIMPPFSAEDLEVKMGADGWGKRLLRLARKGRAMQRIVEAVGDNGREGPMDTLSTENEEER